MRSTRPSRTERTHPRRQAAAGVTLIELLVGLVIGLIASLAVAQVMVGAEGQRRAITTGSDAQVSGALGLAALQRALAPAGYGFTATPGAIGCALDARFGGSPVTGFPAVLAPVVITDGAGGLPDTIRVLASGKASFAIPVRLSAGYDPADPVNNQRFQVPAVIGIEGPGAAHTGDLLVAAGDAARPCQVFQANGAPAGTTVPRTDDAAWNAPGFPDTTFDEGDFLVNLGVPVDVTFAVDAKSLVATKLEVDAGVPAYAGPSELMPNVVNLQAMYGKDTDGNGTVDAWDTSTPATNAGWLQIVAVRVAVVARSAHFEKDEVTTANPQWNVGSAASVAEPTVPCGTSACLAVRVDHLPDWKHYRYRLFETTVPLRNMLWRPA